MNKNFRIHEQAEMKVQIEEDETDWSVMSDLSIGNQTYIMDLALQKEAREKNCQEECREEALVLYQQAKKEGHSGEKFFLTIFQEIERQR